MWFLIYNWIMIGKWRRWCIPGALLGLFATTFWQFLVFGLRNSPIKQAYVRAFYFSLMEPIAFIFKIKFLYKPIIIYIIVHIWFAVLGTAAAYIVGFLWKLVIRKPQSENCYNEKIEIIEL